MKNSIDPYILCENVYVRIILVENEDDFEVSRRAYTEVKKLATDIYGIRDWAIEKNSMGKPYYANNSDYTLSISHSDKRVAIAVCKGYKIGIDIEQVHKVSDKIINKYYTKAEKKQVKNGSWFAETRIWTRKEAYSKCVGTGLDKYSLRWDTTDNNMMLFESMIVNDYIVSVCKEYNIINKNDAASM